MQIEESVIAISDDYDTFFVDVYGVLYNGVTLYDGTLETMKELRKLGKKIVILSNSTMVAADARRSCENRGMYEGVHYDKFVTSGEYLHYVVTSKPQEISEKLGKEVSSVKCLFMSNASVFADSQINKIDSFESADMMYVGVPRTSYGSVQISDLFDEKGNHINIEDVVSKDWHKLHDSQGRKGTEEFALVLEKCLEHDKILLVANPDIFAYESGASNVGDPANNVVAVFTQGSLGKYYEKIGGKVVYFGKPYTGIFAFARKFADPNDRIVMVGDTPWTDILGANCSGIDSALVTTGVSGEFLKRSSIEKLTEENFENLYTNIAKKMCNLEGSLRPTHILSRFARNVW